MAGALFGLSCGSGTLPNPTTFNFALTPCSAPQLTSSPDAGQANALCLPGNVCFSSTASGRHIRGFSPGEPMLETKRKLQLWFHHPHAEAEPRARPGA